PEAAIGHRLALAVPRSASAGSWSHDCPVAQLLAQRARASLRVRVGLLPRGGSGALQDPTGQPLRGRKWPIEEAALRSARPGGESRVIVRLQIVHPAGGALHFDEAEVAEGCFHRLPRAAA